MSLRLRLCLSLSLTLGLSPSPSSPPPSDSSPLRQHERSSLEAAIAALEYRAGWSGEELQAPNRAHNLRTYFGAEGVRVHDRTARGSPLLVALRASQVGRASALVPVAVGELHHEASRVEIRRPGLVEWYENRPDGLEQGFTLAQPPSGDGELVLALALDGANAVLREGELALTSRATGRRLAYTKLVALDADGRTLPSRMELASDTDLRLVVDDGGAAYPVVIDPLIGSAPDAQLESDEPLACFGSAVSGAGDVNGDGFADVIVGAPCFGPGATDSGAAFVFLGSATGITGTTPASAHAVLSGPAGSTEFGFSVAAAGDVNGDGYSDVVVGAPGYPGAFVFHGSAAGIASAIAEDAQGLLSGAENSRFGASVAGAGDVNGDGYDDVIVGARWYTGGETEEGAVFVFHGGLAGVGKRSDFEAATKIESNLAGTHFGWSVAGAGDVNRDGYADVVTASKFYGDSGTAFVFHGGPGGIPNVDAAGATTILEGDQVDLGFGSCVSSAGDVNGDGYGDLVVGAALYETGLTYEGAAFIFHGGASGIPDGPPASAQGRFETNQTVARVYHCSDSGDVNGDGYGDLIVGSQYFDSGEVDEGAAFVFLGGRDGIGNVSPLAAHAQLESNDAHAESGPVGFAGDVNGDGFDDVIVGAWLYDSGEPDEGAAFVYHGGALGIADGTPASAAGRALSADPGANLGVALANAGDVNGDGHTDVIVGAPSFDGGEVDEGAAFVYHGSLEGLGLGPAVPLARLESDQANARMGSAVSGGDVNNDGYADVIVGAPYYQNGETLEGAAFIFLGGPGGVANGTPATAATRLESNQALATFGIGVSLAGDVNGDGFADAIVGSPHYAAGELSEGAVFVFHGGPGGIASGDPSTAPSRLESNQTDSEFGYQLALAGDVNGDEFGDVIVGAYRYDSGQNDEGAAFLFHGSATGVASGNPSTAATRIESDQVDAQLGVAVASAGDVDADGLADVIVGAFAYTTAVTGGAAFVFHGHPDGIAHGSPATAATILSAEDSGSALGVSVSGVGDTDGDGFADVAVGAVGQRVDGLALAGRAYLFRGGPLGVQSTGAGGASAIFSGNQEGTHLGFALAGGDFNSDGFADVIVGAPGYPFGGAAFVFASNGGIPGNANRVRQRTPTPSLTTREVAPWGSTDRTDRVEIGLIGRYPAGRQAYQVEVEFCPKAFGVLGCQRHLSGWEDSGPSSGINTRLTVLGLDPGRLYRWRARLLHAPLSVLAPGIAPPPNPAHGRWLRPGVQANEGDFRTAGDADLDGVIDVLDNCPTIANASQLDADMDLVGDVCDNCTSVANPRVAATFLAGAPWATLTGGQRDDDHDGFGNRCDGKFPGVAGTLIGSGDLVQFRASNGKSRGTDTCGTTGTRPCAIFDLDEAATLVGTPDLSLFRSLNGKLPGPKCTACPLPCTAGASGTCGAIP